VSGNILLIPIFVPIVFGLAVLGLKRWAWGISALASAFTFITSIAIFLQGNLYYSFDLRKIGIQLSLKSYDFSAFVAMAIAFFACLIVVYSLKFFKSEGGSREYYGNILITLGASCGAVLSSDLVMLMVFWGITGLTLYNLISLGGPRASDAAKKTFVIIGGTDALMIFGVSIIWSLTNTFEMDSIRLSLNGFLPILAYLCIAVGALAKAGAIPFHSWIPDSAEAAPVPVMAYLPASLDKLLGIYLLARISLDLFTVIPNSLVSIILLVVGSVTIVAAGLAALVQHNMKKLLAFCAVSQVGYIVIGIGTGIPVGIAGGLFHMINHAIYKCCLFLGGGAVEREANTSELDRLGGLGKAMPVTFVVMIIAALSISGIPPFNGFVSKWMIYQGVISLSKEGGGLWLLWLTAAMFGSALTLAGFMKLINAVFLGSNKEHGNIKEVPPTMRWPMITLAILCVVFGIFAFPIPLKYFILPVVPFTFFSGAWAPVLAAFLILVGLIIGFLIFLIGRARPTRVSTPFVGGEEFSSEQLQISGVRFYDTIRDLDVIKDFYDEAEKKVYDLYEQLKRLTFWLSDFFRWMHSGLLHTYLAWCLLGLVLLLFVFFR
jgi:formate hydrogenlyase subunit 3/multisubunit Na+/H+ antiporter MnhD subunit